jgi:hypothetical protein
MYPNYYADQNPNKKFGDYFVKMLIDEGVITESESGNIASELPKEEDKSAELEEIMRREIDFENSENIEEELVRQKLAEQEVDTRHAVEEYKKLNSAGLGVEEIAQLGVVLSDPEANFYAKQTALFELRRYDEHEYYIKEILLKFLKKYADSEGDFLNDWEKSWLVRTAIGSLRVVDPKNWDKIKGVDDNYVENELIANLKELVRDAQIHGKDIKDYSGRTDKDWNMDGLKSALFAKNSKSFVVPPS